MSLKTFPVVVDVTLVVDYLGVWMVQRWRKAVVVLLSVGKGRDSTREPHLLKNFLLLRMALHVGAHLLLLVLVVERQLIRGAG